LTTTTTTLASAGAGLYLHVPFCARACPYCDFDFRVDPRPDIEGFLGALDQEVASRDDVQRRFETVYVGGGTPSVFAAADLRRLLGWIRDRFDVAGAGEWTVEFNPEHVDTARLDALARSGVDRISLGVQSLQRRGLVQLGRAHTAADALQAVRGAVAAGLRVSADLIVGWPGHDPSSIAGDVGRLGDAGVEHVSIYALTIEPDTPWTRLVERGARAMPDPDAQADALLCADDALARAGFTHYEIASFARTAAAQSRHNLGYWRWRDYVGLGPSAASARACDDGGIRRRANPPGSPPSGQRGLAAWPGAAPDEEILSPERAAAEGLWLGLRVLAGLPIAAFVQRFPACDRAWIEARTARQRELGNLQWSPDGETLRVAPDRWLHHDAIAADLLLAPGSE
jgi:oxygen-independent coproporphyrinogen-3 oxidase